MTSADIVDMLENIGRAATPRLSPAVQLPGETASDRRQDILRAIRGTVLPRRLDFNASDGTCMAIEVNSSRVTDVFAASTGAVPDFETESREDLTGKVAQLVSNLSTAPGPLHMTSRRPDAALEADDVGVTYSEIAAACAQIDLPDAPPAEPVIAVVSDTADARPQAEADQPSLLRQFYDMAGKFALGRVLDQGDGTPPETDGACDQGQPLHPDQPLLDRLSADLSGWDADTAPALGHPQLIVMRPAGGTGAALALLRDGSGTTAVVHQSRKLGAVISAWNSIAGAKE